jgi:thiopeptide-type bacteriocin biosynthesis protein
MLAELEPEIDLFHFLRYGDPAHHVRVRFRVKESGSASRARERAVRFVETLTPGGIVDGAVWDVYDREIERYGGLRSIETAERIFDVDSRALLNALRVFRTSDDAMRDILRDVADFTVALCGGERRALETIRPFIGGRRDRLTPKQWATVKAARERPHGSQYLPIAELADTLRATAETDVTEIVRALIHMHCNRLGLHVLEEERALHLVAAIFEGDVATRLR